MNSLAMIWRVASRSRRPQRGGRRPIGSRLRVEELEARNLMAMSSPPLSLPPLTGMWTALNTPAPDNIGTMMLLTDGTVMAQGGGVTDQWYHLSPTGVGSYVNGTWGSLAAMSTQRLYFASDVLPDGRVLVLGGEYSGSAGAQNLTNTGEIFDPTVDAWTPMANYPQANFGDDPSAMLPNGHVLLGYIFDGTTYSYDPSTDTYTQTATKLLDDASDEETWLTLPDGSILSYDVFNEPHAQRYLPATDQWVDAGTVPVDLSGGNATGFELGGAAMLPDGRAFFLGANGNTAFYDPSSNTWTQGTSIPNGLGADDAPMAMMPNGHILLSADTPLFNGPTSVFDFDPTGNGGAGSYTDVTPAFMDMTGPAFVDRMLMLPSGGVLFTNGSNQLAIYTPNGSPSPSWQPTITGYTNNGDGTYTLSGARLSGISQGAFYGDDAEMATNYPIVQLTDPSGNVFYARTTNWSNTGISSPGDTTPQSVVFTPPAGLPTADYSLVVIASGIPSTPVDFPYQSPPHLASLEIQAPVEVTAGVPFTATVTALDQNGNVFATYTGTVQFSSNDLAAVLPGPYRFRISDGGSHTFTNQFTMFTAGQRTLTVTDSRDNLTATASILVDPVAVASISYMQEPLDTFANTVMTPAVTLGLYDRYGNLEVNDNSDTVTIAIGNNPSNGKLGGTTTVTVSSGIATFSDLTISTPGARYSLVATNSLLPGSLPSAAFTVKSLYNPPGTIIEDFENFPSEPWTLTGTNTFAGQGPPHDGNNGLDITGPDWIYRTDSPVTVKAGDSLSVWMLMENLDGRAYFGFGSSKTATLALVVAPNTNQLMLMSVTKNYSTYTTLGAVSYNNFQAGVWYRLQVDWSLSGAVTGRLFASNGTSLLTRVTASVSPTGIKSGGIAFRGLGTDKLFDTVIDLAGVGGGSGGAPMTTLPSGSTTTTKTPVLPVAPDVVAPRHGAQDNTNVWTAAMAEWLAQHHRPTRLAAHSPPPKTK